MLSRVMISVVILSLAALACGVNVDLPKVPTAGPTQVDQISIPAPAGEPIRLAISFGAGELSLAPGASQLLEGTAEYNIETLKPEIVTEDGRIEIKQGDILGLVEPSGVKSTWDFKLGSMPMDLEISAGAYEGNFELGGLALTGLTIKDGAASAELNFGEPNSASMQVFRYETGASQVKMTGLANADFSTMIFGSGAGDYELGFDGQLKRDATLTISTGLSNLTLTIPNGVPATITMETPISNVNVPSSWAQSGNRYTQEGSGPKLTFIIKGGAGNLTIRN